MESFTQTDFRKDLFNKLRSVANDNETKEITASANSDLTDDVILVSKREWERMQEELYLERTGTLHEVFKRMDNAQDGDFEEA